MEVIRIRIETGNAAFEVSPATELGRILRDLADRVEDGTPPDFVRDINGNRCGEFTIEKASIQP